MKRIYTKNLHITVLVDDEDYEYLKQFNWFVSTKGYITRNVKKPNGKWTKVYMHRELLKTEKGVDTEHADQNKANNQKSNLRPSTRSQNMANVHKVKKENAHSKYKGVSFLKRVGLYVAYIRKDYQQIHIGYFNTEVEAAHCYNQFAEQLFGKFASLNEIDV